MKVPAWVIAKVDQRLALMDEVLGPAVAGLDEYAAVMTPLTEPGENATPAEMLRWERACDNCDRYCRDEFYTGHYRVEHKGTKVIFTFGSCPACKDLT